MKLPRDLAGPSLARALRVLGYEVTRQTGSHMRLTTEQGGEHHITIPAHNPLRVDTLAAMQPYWMMSRRTQAAHAGISRDELLAQLFG